MDTASATVTPMTAPDPFLTVVTRHATLALHAGMAGNWEQAVSEIQKLARETGFNGVTVAMMAWIDTALKESGFTEYGDSVRLKWQAAETGHVTSDADELPPAVRWAGRLFAARLADDESLFESLIHAIPQDPAGTGDYIMAVLESAVLTIHRDSQT